MQRLRKKERLPVYADSNALGGLVVVDLAGECELLVLGVSVFVCVAVCVCVCVREREGRERGRE